MAQQWKHGWIPLTPGAVRAKNHGKTPGKGSKLGRRMAALKKPSRSGGRSASSLPQVNVTAPQRLKVGDTFSYRGVDVTVLSKPEKDGGLSGKGRGARVYGQRADTGAKGWLTLSGGEPVAVTGRKKVEPVTPPKRKEPKAAGSALPPVDKGRIDRLVKEESARKKAAKEKEREEEARAAAYRRERDYREALRVEAGRGGSRTRLQQLLREDRGRLARQKSK